jgi:hypothetical protein
MGGEQVSVKQRSSKRQGECRRCTVAIDTRHWNTQHVGRDREERVHTHNNKKGCGVPPRQGECGDRRCRRLAAREAPQRSTRRRTSLRALALRITAVDLRVCIVVYLGARWRVGWSPGCHFSWTWQGTGEAEDGKQRQRRASAGAQGAGRDAAPQGLSASIKESCCACYACTGVLSAQTGSWLPLKNPQPCASGFVRACLTTAKQ